MSLSFLCQYLHYTNCKIMSHTLYTWLKYQVSIYMSIMRTLIIRIEVQKSVRNGVMPLPFSIVEICVLWKNITKLPETEPKRITCALFIMHHFVFCFVLFVFHCNLIAIWAFSSFLVLSPENPIVSSDNTVSLSKS